MNLHRSNVVAPKIYGLPKIHKLSTLDNVQREKEKIIPIISCITAPKQRRNDFSKIYEVCDTKELNAWAADVTGMSATFMARHFFHVTYGMRSFVTGSCRKARKRTTTTWLFSRLVFLSSACQPKVSYMLKLFLRHVTYFRKTNQTLHNWKISWIWLCTVFAINSQRWVSFKIFTLAKVS